MKLGIIGLPQSGKTTIFNALTRGNAPTTASAGRFEVHTAVVDVPDPRVDTLSAMFKPKKTIYAKVTYADIAGLESGAAKSGISGQLLNQLTQMDGLLLVVRGFEDDSVLHTMGSIDPARDADIMLSELLLNDLIAVERKLERLTPLQLGSEENPASMEPREYKLQVGKGYRWKIQASDLNEYALVAPDFFRNVWIRKVEVGGVDRLLEAMKLLRGKDRPRAVSQVLVTVLDQDARSPVIHQFSVDVQRQLPGEIVVALGYVGSRSRHLVLGQGNLNINQLETRHLALGSALLQTVTNPYYAAGGPGLVGARTLTQSQLLRPFPHFSAVNLASNDQNRARYDSMVLKAQKRHLFTQTFVGLMCLLTTKYALLPFFCFAT